MTNGAQWTDTTQIKDLDGDTKVQTNETNDEDIIRFDTAGTERAHLDATSLDMTVDVDFNQLKAVAMVADGGATLSADATGGQWFLHAPTGRTILMQFSDTILDSGTADTDTLNKLVDSTQTDFSTTVSVGNVAHNTTDDTYGFVTDVESNTSLLLDGDVFPDGDETYEILVGWVPIISYGTMTVFVDNSAGEDSPNNGLAFGATAFRTTQFAIDCIPGLVGGNVFLNIDEDTYVEDLVLRGKQVTGNFTITLQGTQTEELSETTATGGSEGGVTTQATIITAAATFTPNAHDLQWVKFEDDTTTAALQGLVRVIKSNDATTLTLIDRLPANPVNGDTFTIITPGTIFRSDSAPENVLEIFASNITFNDIKFDPSVAPTLGFEKIFTGASSVQFNNCWFLRTVSRTVGMHVASAAAAGAADCLYQKTFSDTASHYAIFLNSFFVPTRCAIFGNTIGPAATNRGIYITYGGQLVPEGGQIDTWEWGVYCDINGSARTQSANDNRKRVFITNCDTGIGATQGGVFLTRGNVHYSGNNTNEDNNTGGDDHGFVG